MKKLMIFMFSATSIFAVTGCTGESTETPVIPDDTPGDVNPDDTPGDTNPDDTPGDTDPDDTPGDTDPDDTDPEEDPEETPPALEDLLKDVVFEFREGVELEETIQQGDFFDNQYPMEDFDGNLFYKDYGFVQDGETTKSFNSMLVGEHEAFFTLTFKGNDQFEKQEVMRISRDITIAERDMSNYVNPEQITTSDQRILNEIYVDNSDQLEDAVKDAIPGDAIILRDGSYGELNTKIEANGTPENPIFIMAQNEGQAVFTEDVNINTKGAFLMISGLNFTGGPKYDSGVFKIEGNYNRITNITMTDLTYKVDSSTGWSSKHSWMQIAGMYNEVDNSTFEGKDSHGVLMVVSRVEGKEDHHHIHHNHFLDFSNPTELTNEFEVIRIGTSSESRGMSYTKVEYNLFDGMDAEAENISVKAGGNEIRGNVILNSASSITLRHGVDNIVEDNIIIGNDKVNSGGIRVFDEGHIIRNNYISGINVGESNNYRGAIVLHAGNNSDGGTTSDNGQWTARDVVVEGNTIHNSTRGLTFENVSDRKYGPERITLKDNLIYSDNDTDLAISYESASESALETFIFENNQIYVADNMLTDTENIFDGSDVIISSTRPTLTLTDNINYLDGVGVVGLNFLTVADVGSNK